MTVNGKTIDLTATNVKTLDELLEYLNLSPNSVAIEKNGSIVEKGFWSKENLSSSDSVEIIKFVGGG